MINTLHYMAGISLFYIEYHGIYGSTLTEQKTINKFRMIDWMIADFYTIFGKIFTSFL